MKNKYRIIGIIALIAIIGLAIVSCKDVTTVDYKKPGKPSKVEAEIVTNLTWEQDVGTLFEDNGTPGYPVNDYVQVTAVRNAVKVKWNGAANVQWYRVFFKQEGKNFIDQIWGDNEDDEWSPIRFHYKYVDGSDTYYSYDVTDYYIYDFSNDGLKKFAYFGPEIWRNEAYGDQWDIYFNYFDGMQGKKFRFGVASEGFNGVMSDIVWSSVIDIPNQPIQEEKWP